MRSRNFTSNEVIHRAHALSTVSQAERDLVREIAPIAMGYVQCLRDALCEEYRKDVPLAVSSGWREKAYNDEISNESSMHRWRMSPQGVAIFALDVWSPILTPHQLYISLKDLVKGETYEHKRFKFVHVAPYGPDEEWIQ